MFARRPRPVSLLTMLMAASLIGSLAGRLPSIAAPAADSAKTHVYPGAQSIHEAAATDAATSTDTTSDMDSFKPANGSHEEETSQTGKESSVDATATGSGSAVDASSDKAAAAANSDKTAADEEQAAAAEAAEDPAAAEAASQQLATPHYIVATHYFNKWDLDLAELEFDETVSLYPNFRIAHRDLCLLSLAKLNLARSLAEFMMVTGLGDPVAYTDSERQQLNDKAFKAHYKKGLAYGQKNNWSEAITELQWAESYHPADPAVHHSLAFAFASTGDFARAEEQYKVTFANSPQDGMAHADFADLLAAHGQSVRAEAEMRKAATLDPNAAALHVDLGWMAESRHDIATATQEFKTAVQLSPKHPGLWVHLARLCEQQGDAEGAQSAYRNALEVDHNYAEATDGLTRLKQTKT